MINSHLLYQLSYQGMFLNCAHYVYFEGVGQVFTKFNCVIFESETKAIKMSE